MVIMVNSAFHLFSHSFNKYLFNIHYGPSTPLNTGNTTMDKTDLSHALSFQAHSALANIVNVPKTHWTFCKKCGKHHYSLPIKWGQDVGVK